MKRIKRPLTMVNLPDFSKDFYCYYKPNFIKNQLSLFYERILQKEKKNKWNKKIYQN